MAGKTMDQRRKEQMARAEEMRGTWDEYEYRYILNGGTNDVEDALYAETEAWHGKGRVHVDGGIPFEIAMMDPAINWEVELRPLAVPTSGEEYLEDDITDVNNWQQVPEAFATVRKTDDAILGVVGSRYEPIQNHQGFEWLKALTDADEMLIESVMSLRGGKTVAIEARRPDHILIGGEKVIPFSLFTNSHDGSGQAKMLCTDERTVCANTLRFAELKAKNSYSVRHVKGADIKLAEARAALEISFDYSAALKELGEELLMVPFNDTKFVTFLDFLVEIPEKEIAPDDNGNLVVVNQRTIDNRLNMQAEMFDLYRSADNLENIRKTAWGALQAVVEYEEHHRNFRSADRRVENILSANNRGQEALKILTA